MSTGIRGVSVIMCCYNSALRLPETLKHLALQNVPFQIEWEVIVVNNASEDNTKNIAVIEWNKYNINVPFKVIDEFKPGLSNARDAGVNEAKFQYIIFCDDDNWLSQNYVVEAFNSMENNPKAGAIGGIGLPICEVAPPEWFVTYKLSYATGSQGKVFDELGIEDITETKGYVYGAGAVFRKKALRDVKLAGFKSIVTDRIGNLLVSGGDNEMCYGLIFLGYRILYNSKLTFNHFIPGKRLTKSYLLKLSEGYGFSSILLLPYEYKLKNKSLSGIKTKWWWLLSTSIFLYLKNDLPGMVTTNYKKNFPLQLNIAIRAGTIKSILKHRKMFKSNFRYLNSLTNNRVL